MEKVAPHTRICAYNRAGLFDSDPAPTPRTSLDMINDLHNLLINAGIDGPYILVGHSLGGMNALIYSDQYPQDVVGLVLVDPGARDTYQRMLETLPAQSADELRDVVDCRETLEWIIDWWNSSDNEEGIDIATSADQVDKISSLGDFPLIVITDTLDRFCRGELGDQEKQIWKDLHAEYAALSTNGIQVFTDSGHQIPMYDPEAIIDAILAGARASQEQIVGAQRNECAV